MSRQALPARSTLRACFSLFKIKTAEGFQYRLAGFAGASTGIFWALIEIMVFSVFYNYAARSDAGIMAGMTFKQVVSYVWLGQVMWLMQPMSIDRDILAQITSGDVGIELCRPIDLYFHWFARTAAARLTPLFWRGSVILLCGMLMPAPYRLSLPASVPGLIWMLISLVCAFLLCTAFGTFASTVRLSVNWGDGPIYLMMLIGGVLSGNYLPLQLWPDFMQRFLLLQPFAGYLDIPVRLYLGTMRPDVAAGAVLLQLAWVTAFFAVGKALMNRRLKTIIIQGG
jgi:ABC-2 type transport system permease protein